MVDEIEQPGLKAKFEPALTRKQPAFEAKSIACLYASWHWNLDYIASFSAPDPDPQSGVSVDDRSEEAKGRVLSSGIDPVQLFGICRSIQSRHTFLEA